MIQPGESTTKAVRAVFVIDPKGIIRTIIYYPLSLGRNFDELYRVLIALQTADAFPSPRRPTGSPGDDVIVPTAGSCGVAKERMEGKEDMTCHDWFFCTKKLDKGEGAEHDPQEVAARNVDPRPPGRDSRVVRDRPPCSVRKPQHLARLPADATAERRGRPEVTG